MNEKYSVALGNLYLRMNPEDRTIIAEAVKQAADEAFKDGVRAERDRIRPIVAKLLDGLP